MGESGSRRPKRIRSVATTKTAIMAVFLAATFGLMALLSVPSRFLPPPLRIPRPIKQALNPFEPLIPSILGPGRQPKMHGSQGLVGVGVRQLPLVSAFRPHPSPPPPVSKGPGPPPPPIPSLDHGRASGGHGFEPDGRDGHEGRRGSHRRHHRHHRPHRPNPCCGRKWELFFRELVIRTAARPVHRHWPVGPGHRAGRAR